MKHAKVSGAWRPVRAHHRKQRNPEGVLSAFLFNLCLVLLPVAAATALIVIARDQLYAYEYSDAGGRAVADRVARLNGELIQLDFDRQNQWEALVDMELRDNDFTSARGFLLSASGMLSPGGATVFNRDDASEAELEAAALQLLSPSTRERYETLRARDRAATASVAVGNSEDFEIMARALLREPENDALQFILTGYSLGLAGDLSPRMAQGARTLLDASRRDDFPVGLSADVNGLFNASMPIQAFRQAGAEASDAGALAGAFTASIDAERAAEARALLDQVGAISEATSPSGAVALLSHAGGLRDVDRLQLLAQASGDRAAAAAKRLPRDGRLIDAARGQLTMNQDLIAALVAVGVAMLGLIAIVVMKVVQGALSILRSWNDEEYGGELMEISTNNWRPL